MFTNQKLKQLIIPLVIEQILSVLVGMSDIVMVSSVSEAAVSGVSLVDSISVLIINIFAALATGGAVVAAQYLGKGDEQKACFSAKQLILCTVVISAVIMAVFLVAGSQLITLIFGHVEMEVLQSARIYLLITSLSYPFIALYNSCAALYRAMGNSRISMFTSLIMNALNIVGNAILIYGFGMGVEGAAIPTLLSRMVCALMIVMMLRHRQTQIRLDSYFHLGLDFTMIRRILQIGVPNGLENGMFQIGKILVQSLVSLFGTASIAANAVANNFAQMEIIPAAAIGLGMVTVVGQCMGAGKVEEAERAEYRRQCHSDLRLWYGSRRGCHSDAAVTDGLRADDCHDAAASSDANPAGFLFPFGAGLYHDPPHSADRRTQRTGKRHVSDRQDSGAESCFSVWHSFHCG